MRDYSFGHFFKIALEERASKRALALNTVTRYKKTYSAFLAPLANLDVRNITKDYLKCYERIERYKYDINAFAILFSSYTGVRAGEIPTLKWNDIDFEMKQIHIHTQQLIENGTTREVPYTKDEKGFSAHHF